MMIGMFARTTRAVSGASPRARSGSHVKKSMDMAPAPSAASTRKPASQAIGKRRGKTIARAAEETSLDNDDVWRFREEFEAVGGGVWCGEVVMGGESPFIELQGFSIQ